MSRDSYDEEQDELKRKAGEYDKMMKEKDAQPEVSMQSVKKENTAIEMISVQLIDLTPEARARVLSYVMEYFKVNWFMRRGAM